MPFKRKEAIEDIKGTEETRRDLPSHSPESLKAPGNGAKKSKTVKLSKQQTKSLGTSL
jgi:hypothetical protein